MHSKLWAINRITRSLDYNAMVALILHIWIVCCMVCCSEKPIRLQLLKNIWQSCSLYSIIKLLNACVGLVVPGSRLPHISMRSRPFACTQLSSPWQPYSCRPAWRHQKSEGTKKRQSMGSDDEIILIQINMVPYVAPTNYIEKAGATVVRGHT